MRHAIVKVMIRSSSRIVLTCTAVLFSTTLFAQSPEIKQVFRLIDIEQPSKATGMLEKITSTSTNQYYIGLAYLKTGKKNTALAAFQKGISLSEKDALNYAGIGHINLLDKKPAEAKANFDKALSMSKQKDANVLKAVATAYMSDPKMVVDAINLLNKAKTLNATDPEVHLLLGDAYLMQNNGSESVNSYERAAAADPKNAKAHYKVARVYERSRNNEMVKENLNKAVGIDPEFGPAWKELAEVYYIEKQADKAVQAAEKYMGLSENADEAKFFYAFVLFMAKQYDKANAIFQSVLNKPNAPAVAYKFYAYSLLEQAKNENDTTKKTAVVIKDVFDKYFGVVKPADITASDVGNYAKVLMKLKQDAVALENLDKSIKMDSSQIEFLQLNGELSFKLKKYDKSISAFNRILKLRQQPLAADYYHLGRAYFYNDQFTQADSAFTKLAEKQPNVTHGHLWAAKSRANIDSTGVRGLAIPAYNRFIEIASQSPEKNKRDLIDAYYYLAGYQLSVNQNVAESKKYIEKILQLDPKHKDALEFMNTLKQQ